MILFVFCVAPLFGQYSRVNAAQISFGRSNFLVGRFQSDFISEPSFAIGLSQYRGYNKSFGLHYFLDYADYGDNTIKVNQLQVDAVPSLERGSWSFGLGLHLGINLTRRTLFYPPSNYIGLIDLIDLGGVGVVSYRIGQLERKGITFYAKGGVSIFNIQHPRTEISYSSWTRNMYVHGGIRYRFSFKKLIRD
jgi:hypothetical protein